MKKTLFVALVTSYVLSACIFFHPRPHNRHSAAPVPAPLVLVTAAPVAR